MSTGPEQSRTSRPRPSAWEWPRWPWTLVAFVGIGITALDLLGAPIAFRVQILGLVLLGLGLIGGAVAGLRVRR